MRILVDMDDTIELLLNAWLAKVNRIYGRHVGYEDITNWDVSAAYEGLSHEQVYDVILEDDFWQEVEPMPGAAEVLERLIQEGHEIYIVTVTPYESLEGKMKYLLFRCFPFLRWDQVIITSRKQLLKADILVDDGIHNLEGGEYRKILVDAPYNRYYDAEANGMIRVHNWTEIEAAIRKIGQELEADQEG